MLRRGSLYRFLKLSVFEFLGSNGIKDENVFLFSLASPDVLKFWWTESIHHQRNKCTNFCDNIKVTMIEAAIVQIHA